MPSLQPATGSFHSSSSAVFAQPGSSRSMAPSPSLSAASLQAVVSGSGASASPLKAQPGSRSSINPSASLSSPSPQSFGPLQLDMFAAAATASATTTAIQPARCLMV